MREVKITDVDCVRAAIDMIYELVHLARKEGVDEVKLSEDIHILNEVIAGLERVVKTLE